MAITRQVALVSLTRLSAPVIGKIVMALVPCFFLTAPMANSWGLSTTMVFALGFFRL